MNFSKFLLLILLVLAYGCTTPETRRIHQTFDTYMQAIQDDQGVLAYSLIDRKTRKYWDELCYKVVYAEKKDFVEFGLFDRIQVVLARLNIPDTHLIGMNGQALFEYAVNQGWVKNDSMQTLGLGEIGINGDFASGNAIARPETSSLYRFHFYKESEAWKIDLTELLKMAEAVLTHYQEESGTTEEDFIFEIVHIITGKPVDPETIYIAPARSLNKSLNLPKET